FEAGRAGTLYFPEFGASTESVRGDLNTDCKRAANGRRGAIHLRKETADRRAKRRPAARRAGGLFSIPAFRTIGRDATHSTNLMPVFNATASRLLLAPNSKRRQQVCLTPFEVIER